MLQCDLQLAKKHHPDTNKSASAAEKFQEISEAYEVREDNTILPNILTQTYYGSFQKRSTLPPPPPPCRKFLPSRGVGDNNLFL